MKLSKYHFSCPHCNEVVNSDKSVVLKTLRTNGETGTIQMSIGVGDYTFNHEPNVDFEEGEMVTFCCPHCDHILDAPQHKDFAILKMNVDKNIEFDIIFSRKAGHRKTYIITEDGIETYKG